MRTRRVVLAVLVFAVAATTASCSVHPGVAAVVDGREIDEAYVQQTVDDLLPYFPSVTTSQVLTVLVNAPAVIEVAESHGLVASEEDAMALLQSGATAAGVEDATFGPGAIEVAIYSVVGKGLAELDVDDVVISPRYGEVGADGMVAPVVPVWIVGTEPVEEPVAQ